MALVLIPNRLFPSFTGLRKLSKNGRRQALITVFSELGVKSLRERRAALRRLRRALSSYWRDKNLADSELTAKEQRRWYVDVQRFASEATRLIGNDPLQIGRFAALTDERIKNVERLAQIFRDLKCRVDTTSPKVRRGGRPRDWPFKGLVRRLGPLYTDSTKRPLRPGTDRVSGKPSGPAFRFVRAVCDLGGIDKTDAAIWTAIRDMGKT